MLSRRSLETLSLQQKTSRLWRWAVCGLHNIYSINSKQQHILLTSWLHPLPCRLLVAVVTTSMKLSLPRVRPSWWACPPSSARTSGSREVSGEVGWLRYNRDHSGSINQLGNLNTAASSHQNEPWGLTNLLSAFPFFWTLHCLFGSSLLLLLLLFGDVLLPCWSIITTCISLE